MNYRVKYKEYTRPFHVFNCGGGQDARATLIGNTTYKKDTGTLFYKSPFVEAIQTKNAVILLDELTRGGHDFWNILFPVLDSTQRCLRLDEQENSPVVRVDESVCFIATANVGNEYTATKVLDKALARRFPIKLEMMPLIAKELKHLFRILFPHRSAKQIDTMDVLCQLSDDLIAQCNLEDSPITTYISPANLVEMAELVMDGFSIEEIAEAAIYTEYIADGGADSERGFVKSIVQKYIISDVKSPINDPLVKSRK